MITDYNRLSGLDKVAILFSVLGESLAITLIKGLPETDVRKIRARIREMGTVVFSVKKKVVEEFYLALISKKFQDDGKGDTKRPFAFLDEMPDEQIIALLEIEEPRIVAMTLAQVSPESQMKVINKLEPDKKGRVLMEMGRLDDVSLEAVVNIASELEEKSHFLPRAVDFSRGGGKSIAKILGQMSSDEEEKYLEAISRESPELAEEVKKYHLTFDNILTFPGNIVRDLMNSVDLDTIAMALKGQSEETVNTILENLPKKKQAMFEPIERAIAKRDVDKAKKTIVDAARQMEKEGRFNLEDILGGGEMVE